MVGEDESNIVNLLHNQHGGDFRSGELMMIIVSRGKLPATVIASHTITIKEEVYRLKGVAYHNTKSQHYTCDVELGGIWWAVCHCCFAHELKYSCHGSVWEPSGG